METVAARLESYLALTHEQRLERLVTLQQQKAALAAEEQIVLHAVMLGYPDVELDTGISDRSRRDREWVDEEIACVLRISPRTAGGRTFTAERLVTVFPDTLTALAQGAISFPHALRLAEATTVVSDEIAQRVEAAVLPKAQRQTPGQFAASIRKALARYDTREQEQQHTEALAGRRAAVYPAEHGMADLYAHLPAHELAAIWDQIQHCADTAAGDPLDERTADQRRADALVDLILNPLTGTAPGGVKTVVNVTVALSTLVGLDEQGANLAGHGPIPAALARAIAADEKASWRRIITSDEGEFLAEDATGFLDHIKTNLDTGSDTYRPNAALDRHVRHRDQTCRFGTPPLEPRRSHQGGHSTRADSGAGAGQVGVARVDGTGRRTTKE